MPIKWGLSVIEGLSVCLKGQNFSEGPNAFVCIHQIGLIIQSHEWQKWGKKQGKGWTFSSFVGEPGRRGYIVSGCRPQPLSQNRLYFEFSQGYTAQQSQYGKDPVFSLDKQ